MLSHTVSAGQNSSMSLTGLKSRYEQCCFPYRKLWRRICPTGSFRAWPSPVSVAVGPRPCSFAGHQQGTTLSLWSPPLLSLYMAPTCQEPSMSWQILLLLLLLFLWTFMLSSMINGSCHYLGPTLTVQDNLPILSPVD